LIAELYAPQIISQRTLMLLLLLGCCYTSHLSLSRLSHDHDSNSRTTKNERLGMLLRIWIAQRQNSGPFAGHSYGTLRTFTSLQAQASHPKTDHDNFL